MKNKLLAVLMVTVLALSTTACGSQSSEVRSADDSDPAAVVESESSDGAEQEVSEAAASSETGVQASQQADLTLAERVSDEEDHYIFELRDDVTREKVYYRTRYGIEIAADLYRPKDFDETKSYAGIVIGPPFGGVKEQGPGVYANELASRGFVTLAFDPAYHGYSGGAPRYTGSSSTYVEDLSAGVDYLGSLSYIDRERIGALGICASGGFAISAASMDSRIKAVVTSALYDIPSLMNGTTGEARKEALDQAAQLRWKRVDTGEAEWQKNYPEEPMDHIPEDRQGNDAEFFEFYGTSRGWHYNALGNITGESQPDMMTLPVTGHVDELNKPLLMITGDVAHSRAFTEDIYNKASEPKEMVVVEGARHIDLYDDVTKIPFDKIESFYNEAFSN
ncbi:alpha/beta hydrolase [Lachnospiraceae bacterium C1.1]|nr:alpha/beta hydrolase [Lachnospiraceae bacterium C1.1]